MEKTNKPNLSSKIMTEVVNFETVRSQRWMLFFIAGVFVFLIIILATGILTYINLQAMQTWDLLSIVKENPEVISQYGREVLQSFWEELPRGLVGGGLISILGLGVFWIVTSRKRHTIMRRIKEVAKYKGKEI